MFYRRLAIFLCLFFLSAGCGGGDGSDEPGATGRVGFGWSGGSVGPSGASSGTGVSPGTGNPVSFVPNGSSAVSLTAIAVAPDPVTVTRGDSLSLHVSGTTSTGQPVELPGTTSATVSYLSSDPAIASVSPAGLVTGVSVGSTTITVTVDSRDAEFSQAVAVTVTPDPSLAAAHIFVSNPTPNSGGGWVSSIAMGVDGRLTWLANNANVNRPLAIAASPSGNFVYAVNIYAFQIATPGVSVFSSDRLSGTVTFMPPVVPSIVPSPQTMVFDPTGRFAYLTSFLGEINGYLAHPDGSLSTNPSVSELTLSVSRGVQLPTFNLAGSVLYVGGQDNDLLCILNVDPANGALSFRHANFAVASGDAPKATLLSADGNHLYVSNSGNDSISSYSNAAVGDLLHAATVATDAEPGPMALNPVLSTLYVAGSSNTVRSFSLGADGSMTATGTALPTGINPVTVLVSPSGEFVYVVSRTDNVISAYAVDPSDGTLSPRERYESFPLTFPSGAVIVSAQ